MKSTLALVSRLRVKQQQVSSSICTIQKQCYSETTQEPHHHGKQFKTSPHQTARNKFIEYRSKHLENYMGVVKFTPGVAHVHQRHIHNEDIPKDVPVQLSDAGKDLYTRVSPVVEFIRSAGWDNLSVHDIEFVSTLRH